MTAEPRFDHDYKYGRQGELLVSGTIAALRDGQVQIEDKRKRRPDNRFYIELEHDPGRTGNYRPSGLSVSEAELWAFVVSDTGCVLFVPAARLREAIRRHWGTDAEERDGSCPTRGRLLSFNHLIASGISGGTLPGANVVTVEELRNEGKYAP